MRVLSLSLSLTHTHTPTPTHSCTPVHQINLTIFEVRAVGKKEDGGKRKEKKNVEGCLGVRGSDLIGYAVGDVGRIFYL